MTTPEPTITICLSRADAEWWRDVIDVPSVWGHKDHANRVLCALIAALAMPASERTEGRCDHKQEHSAIAPPAARDDVPHIDPAWLTAPHVPPLPKGAKTFTFTRDDPRDEPAAPDAGETLESLIAECERHDWEWRIERELRQDGPDSWVFSRVARVRPWNWADNPPDEANSDGWLGLNDDDADGSLVDLLRETMRWAKDVEQQAMTQARGAGRREGQG